MSNIKLFQDKKMRSELDYEKNIHLWVEFS